MRLWHVDLLPFISKQRLQGQHRECCALRGNGWGKKHATVDYVFTYPPKHLVDYHLLVIQNLSGTQHRVNVSEIWKNPYYRGKNCEPWEEQYMEEFSVTEGECLFREHNNDYLRFCIYLLKQKGENMDIVDILFSGGLLKEFGERDAGR